MAMTYAVATPLEELDPVALAQRLGETIASALVRLEGMSGAQAALPAAPGRWSAKQVIGHLIDSAVNNLARIVRVETTAGEEVSLSGYEQDAWVAAQHYAEKEWASVLVLWSALNEHIAWTVSHISRHHLGRRCIFPDAQVSLGFLIEDYIAHLEHHLRQVDGLRC